MSWVNIETINKAMEAGAMLERRRTRIRRCAGLYGAVGSWLSTTFGVAVGVASGSWWVVVGSGALTVAAFLILCAMGAWWDIELSEITRFRGTQLVKKADRDVAKEVAKRATAKSPGAGNDGGGGPPVG